ncbi:LytTR family DNA-binding domain-containing protein [Aquimarina sp. AU474]|uniref:LytR/AlgR family response regulator transcription factor n=1 Tax=Aquimarina sp. AU474 TaxID=2108529 RepID=UPI001359E58B|nr:LytTR family DNA-binding domain-containing protein [Aquimarina sp. AU474]
MRCFLIGSDKNLLDKIEEFLQTHFFYITACEKSDSYLKTEEILKKTKPDVIIVDIAVGIDDLANFLKIVKKNVIDCIFIIPQCPLTIDFLEQNKLSYLIKPIDYTQLRFCINTAYVNRSRAIELQKVLTNIQRTTPKKRIAVPQEKQIQMIPTQDILYIEADINYSHIHIIDKKSMCVSKTLKSFEQLLINNKEFYRIHQSYIINLNYINTIIKTKLPQVLMTNGDILTVSRSKKTNFLKLILQ